MKKIILIFLLYLVSVPVFSQTKTDKIRQMLELTGAGKVASNMMKNLLTSYKSAYPQMDEKLWQDILNSFNEEGLIKQIIPIYDKYYTEDDIDQLIAFYKTPIGKKTVEVLPAITQESMGVGQKWGMEAMEQITKKLKESGH